MLACFVCPERSRVAFQIRVPVCLRVVEAGLLFVSKCTIEKRFQQVVIKLERFIEILNAAIEVSLFKAGDTEIIINLCLVITSAERLVKFSNRIVEPALR